MEVFSSSGSLVPENFQLLGHQREKGRDQIEASGLAHRRFRAPTHHTGTHAPVESKVTARLRNERKVHFPPIFPRITTTDAAGKSYVASLVASCVACTIGPSGSAQPLVVGTIVRSPEFSACAINRVCAGCH